MGLRYQRRIGGNRGLGFNLSNSGVSTSYRTKYGTVSSRGFSIRTGIPGLTFRSGFGKGKDKGATALIILGIIIAGFVLYYSIVILYNFALFLWWFLSESRKLILRKYYLYKERKEISEAESLSKNQN